MTGHLTYDANMERLEDLHALADRRRIARRSDRRRLWLRPRAAYRAA